MPNSLKFLVVDFHAESRFLLVKTLLRKFPGARIFEEEEAERALEVVRTQKLSAVITHRTFEVSGADLVRMFRECDANLAIIMVSGMDRAESARDAGADTFLHYDEWLMIGSVVESHLAAKGIVTKNESPHDRAA